jgi:exopolysaccharide biosynthesis protein
MVLKVHKRWNKPEASRWRAVENEGLGLERLGGLWLEELNFIVSSSLKNSIVTTDLRQMNSLDNAIYLSDQFRYTCGFIGSKMDEWQYYSTNNIQRLFTKRQCSFS